MRAITATPVLSTARCVCGVSARVVGARAVGTRVTTDLAHRGR